MTRLLFTLFGKAIRSHLEANRERPRGFDGMAFAYTMGGHDYYTWPDISQMPAVRQKHIERAMKFADAGIGETTLDSLVEMAEGHLIAGMRKGKDADKSLSRVGHILNEIRNRSKEVIPEEVYYDLCAIFVARKGEDPRTFDAAVHTEKVQRITEAGRAGEDFFLQPPALRRLLGSSLTTEASFNELQRSWIVRRLRMKALFELHSKKP